MSIDLSIVGVCVRRQIAPPWYRDRGGNEKQQDHQNEITVATIS
jgi:hypothetical protein